MLQVPYRQSSTSVSVNPWIRRSSYTIIPVCSVSLLCLPERKHWAAPSLLCLFSSSSLLCVLSCFSHVWLFATPWTVAPQAPPSMEFSRQEYWSGLPCSPSGELPDPGIEPRLLCLPALAGKFFTTIATWEAPHSPHLTSKSVPYISYLFLQQNPVPGSNFCFNFCLKCQLL